MRKQQNASIITFLRRRFQRKTSEAQRLINYRDKLFNNMIKNLSPSNKYLYKKFRNRVLSEQRREKIDYFHRYFETHKF